MARTLTKALFALSLAVPATARAQATMEWIVLSLTPDAAPSQARVVGPPGYAEQLRTRTLREMEIEVPAGSPLASALEAAHRGGRRMNGVRLQPARQTAAAERPPLMDGVVVLSYARRAGDDFARVKIQFNWDRTAHAQPAQPSQHTGTHEVGHWMGLSSDAVLVVPGVAGEQRVQLGNPGTFGEQLERGEIQLLVPPGALRNAIARAGNRTGTGTARLRVTRTAGGTEWIDLASYQWVVPAASADVTKISSITMRFPK